MGSFKAFAKKAVKSGEVNWEREKEMAAGFPEGQFEFQLQEAIVVESSTGNWMIRRQHYCLKGEYAGEIARDTMNLNEMGRGFAMQWLERMGVEVPDAFEGMEEAVAEVAENAPIYVATVKQNDGFTNVRVGRLLEASAEKAEGMKDDDDDTTSDDKPESGDGSGGEEVDVDKGTRVSVKIDGEEYDGVVDEARDEDADVIFDDGDSGTYPYDEITVLDEQPEPEPEPDPPKKTSKKKGGKKGGKGKGKGKTTSKDDGGPATVGDDPNAELVDFVEFCQAHDIEVSDDDDEEALCERITEYEWEGDSLTEEEKNLLEAISATIS